MGFSCWLTVIAVVALQMLLVAAYCRSRWAGEASLRAAVLSAILAAVILISTFILAVQYGLNESGKARRTWRAETVVVTVTDLRTEVDGLLGARTV